MSAGTCIIQEQGFCHPIIYKSPLKLMGWRKQRVEMQTAVTSYLLMIVGPVSRHIKFVPYITALNCARGGSGYVLGKFSS